MYIDVALPFTEHLVCYILISVDFCRDPSNDRLSSIVEFIEALFLEELSTELSDETAATTLTTVDNRLNQVLECHCVWGGGDYVQIRICRVSTVDPEIYIQLDMSLGQGIVLWFSSESQSID